MGGTVSRGNDNQDLVSKLKEAELVRTPEVERTLRLVDRADYFIPAFRGQAYSDSAWREGVVHISAPCIYCEVLEQLELAPGMRFLNIGSGTGYLSTVAGLLLGLKGVNHGIELHATNVAYSEKCLTYFLENSDAVFEREFCRPQFTLGNIMRLDTTSVSNLYDRIYCGAKVEDNGPLETIKRLLAVRGVLVAPVNDKLKKIVRESETKFSSTDVMTVAFAPLFEPEKNDPFDVTIASEADVPSLQLLCVRQFRSTFREVVRKRHPCLPTPRRVTYRSEEYHNEELDDSDGEVNKPRRQVRTRATTRQRENLVNLLMQSSENMDEEESGVNEVHAEIASSSDGEMDMEAEQSDGENVNVKAIALGISGGGTRLDSESSGLGTSVDTCNGHSLPDCSRSRLVSVDELQDDRLEEEKTSNDKVKANDDEENGSHNASLEDAPVEARAQRRRRRRKDDSDSSMDSHDSSLAGRSGRPDVHEEDSESSNDEELAEGRGYRSHIFRTSLHEVLRLRNNWNRRFMDDSEEVEPVAEVTQEQDYFFRSEMTALVNQLPLPVSLRQLIIENPV